MNALIDSFVELRHAPRKFWVANGVYFLDGAAYFGILNSLTLFLAGEVRMSDQLTAFTVSYVTGLVALVMALFGGTVDRLGPRRTITLTIAAALLGRALLVLAAQLPLQTALAYAALTLMAFSGGVMQSAVYAAVKESTDARTSAIGFSLVYALMNGGIIAESFASSLVREQHGTPGVFWMCVGITVAYFLLHLFLYPRESFTNSAEVIREARRAKASWREHPLLQARFAFFIFILLPVRTLFAHQWLTMPHYVTRAYPPEVGARYEWITGLNPLIVLIGTPLVAALTKRTHVLTMMIAGTSLSALSTFLLVPGPNLSALLWYVILFSAGEALWSSRFLEYVASTAPPGRVGIYMGVANIPWFLAKFTTGFYSGALLERYCPELGAKDTTTLWLIYAAIALISPLGLIASRGWLLKRIAGR